MSDITQKHLPVVWSILFFYESVEMNRDISLSFSICTLGCKVNQYESQSMTAEIKRKGFIYKDFNDLCDVYIINSCTVTAQSDKKSLQMLRRARRINPNAVIIFCGCVSQAKRGNLPEISEADFITGNKNKNSLIDIAYELYLTKNNFKSNIQTFKSNVSDISGEKLYEEIKIDDSERARAYIKIQDGCNSKCSYCAIPIARGISRSRLYENIADELHRFDQRGFAEIVLTGIEISSYGEDFKYNEETSNPVKLISLLQKLDKEEFYSIKTIRLGSLDPSILTHEFTDKYKALRYAAPHFHLSVQSASDKVLKKMRRKYNNFMLRENIEYAIKNIADLTLTADIITGFPGETEEDFDLTCNFIREFEIYHTHIFPYSPRDGTEAALMSGQISGEIKNKRTEILTETAMKTKINVLEKYKGKSASVLLEEIHEDHIAARTRNYFAVKININNEKDKNIFKHGKISENNVLFYGVESKEYENCCLKAEFIR